MADGWCAATYTLREWRLEHDTEPRHAELFDADGEWTCPREPVDGADRCALHLTPGERDRRGVDDADLARRLLAELRGDRPLAPGRRPGEFVAVDLGDLELTDDARPDPETGHGSGDTDGDGAGADTARDATAGGDAAGPGAVEAVFVGATVGRLVVGDAVPDCAVSLDGVRATELRVTGSLESLSLSATRVDGPVRLEGAATVGRVRLGAGTRTDRAVSVGDGATVTRDLTLRGDRLGVPGVAVEGGATVGVDHAEDATVGLRAVGVDRPGTDLIARGAETTVAAVGLADATLSSVYLQDGVTVTGDIRLRDATLTGNLQVEAADGRPQVDLTGPESEVAVVAVRDADVESLTVDDGATADAVRVGSAANVPGGVTVTGTDTVVDAVRVTGAATVGRVRLGGGALVRRRLLVDAATLTALDRPDSRAALDVTDPGTRVGAVTVTDATVQGVRVDRASVDGDVAVSGTRLTGPDGRGPGGDTPDGTDGAAGGPGPTEAVLRVVEATVAGDLSVDGGETTGGVVLDRATVRRVTLGGGATVAGTVEVGGESTVGRSVAVEGAAEFAGPLRVCDGARVTGDVRVATGDDALQVHAAHGVAVDGARVTGDVAVTGAVDADGDALWVHDADVGGAVAVRGGRLGGHVTVTGGASLDGDLRLVDGSVDGRVVVEDAAVVEGALHVADATATGVAVVDARVQRRLQVTGDTTVEGPLALERDAAVGSDLVVGAAPDDRGDAQGEPDGEPATAPDGGDADSSAGRADDGDRERDVDAGIDPDAGPGQSADGRPIHPAGDGDRTPEPTPAGGVETTVEGGIRLGDRTDAHPTSGGVSVAGSVALTGTASVAAGLALSDVVVGEDLHVVGERVTVSTGAVDLFDCIVRGKVRVQGAGVDALSVRESRVGESVWVGRVDTGRHESRGGDPDGAATDGPDRVGDDTAGPRPDDDGPRRQGAGRTTVDGAVTVAASPVAENVVVREADLGSLTLEDAAVGGRVDLTAVDVAGELCLAGSTVDERVRLATGHTGGVRVRDSLVDGHLQVGPARDGAVDDRPSAPVPDRDGDGDLTVAGDCAVTGTTVGGDLHLDCRLETGDGAPGVASTDVGGAVYVRPRRDSPGRVDLRRSTLPAGTLVITGPGDASGRCWYDLREAVLGDVRVTFETGEGTAIEHLLMLGTRFDGFRFSALPGGVGGNRHRLHTLGGRGVAGRVDGVPTPAERAGPRRSRRYLLAELFTLVPGAGTGYQPDDPPPAVLEQTYLDAKNGASQVGDDDVAGEFFTLEKRYRRRRLWEALAGVEGASGAGGVVATGLDWLENAVFDRVAVYGESPTRVVTVSATLVGLFAVAFAVLLDQPPYGDQYLGSGVLPESVALALQPLTLSVESFVTLVLVGPADQRLTPLVHLLGQVEGFLGVFLVALFVFTLTRSVHR